MNLKRKLKLTARGMTLLGSLFLLTACQEEQREITTNHSSATTTAVTSGSRAQEDRKAEAALGRSKGWDRKVVAASAQKETSPAEESTESEAGEELAVEQVAMEEVASEELVSVEEAPAERVYEEPVVESTVPAAPVVEEAVPAEPVYTYSPTYEEVVLPYSTQYIPNPQMDNDQFIIHQQGVDGKEIHTWLHSYKDGVWDGKHITKTSRFEPVPEIIEVGTNVVVVPGRSTYEAEVAKMKERFPEVFKEGSHADGTQ